MSDNALTADGQVIALLCAPLTSHKRAAAVRPLTTAEWVRFARRIAASEWKRPGELIGRGVGELEQVLELEFGVAERVARLLDRGVLLAAERDRLRDRGIWMLTRAEPEYPSRLRARLLAYAPPVLFGVGPMCLLADEAVAVVGSRDVAAEGHSFAARIGERLAMVGRSVISGAARGVDRAAMDGCLEAGGRAVGVPSESLEATIRARSIRQRVLEGKLTMITPGHPAERFSVAGAMARNKLIYCLAEQAVVVASAESKGGTWAGAIENLTHRWVPLFVRIGDGAPAGNIALLNRGGVPIDDEKLSQQDFVRWLSEASTNSGLNPSPAPDTAISSESIAGNSSLESHGDLPPYGPRDLLIFVWPHIAAFLEKPRTIQEVANAFMIEESQADCWLQRALTEGWVAARGHPTLYSTASALVAKVEQTALFADDPVVGISRKQKAGSIYKRSRGTDSTAK